MGQRSHYAVLDGLRGLAAFSVVVFHIGSLLKMPGLATNGWLAVDFFFCLSGYVLALSYSERLKTSLTFARFVGLRLIRLMPMAILAILISGLYYLNRLLLQHEIDDSAAVFIAIGLGVCNLPFLNAPAEIGGPYVFPINAPQHSLFFEMVVNLVWAGLRRLNGLVTALVISGCCMLFLLGGEWGGDETANFWQGFPRVGASFFLGNALFYLENRWLRPVPDRFWRVLFGLAFAAMIGLFYWPHHLPAGMTAVWIIVLSPVLVVAGARMTLTGWLHDGALLLGAWSYPLYILHFPVFIWGHVAWLAFFGSAMAVGEGALLLGVALVLSYLALRCIDEPCRALLTRYTLRRAAAE